MLKRGPKAQSKGTTLPQLDGKPSCPTYLAPVAKKKWKQLVDLMEELGVLSRADTEVLELYCSLYALKRESDITLETEGVTIDTPNGFKIRSPHYTISIQCGKDLARLLTQLGLTPKARAAIAVEPKTQIDPKWKDLVG